MWTVRAMTQMQQFVVEQIRKRPTTGTLYPQA
jgi:hypothetical protein